MVMALMFPRCRVKNSWFMARFITVRIITVWWYFSSMWRG
jgi:hypothetical protein